MTSRASHKGVEHFWISESFDEQSNHPIWTVPLKMPLLGTP